MTLEMLVGYVFMAAVVWAALLPAVRGLPVTHVVMSLLWPLSILLLIGFIVAHREGQS